MKKYARLIERASVVIEAMPYIRKFAGKTVVIKFGGSAQDNDERNIEFAKDVVLLRYVGINPVVIHGGGKEITEWMRKLGKETKFINGLRITDEETVEVAEMVLSGKISKWIVGYLNKHGGNAVSLNGKDGKLFTAKRITKEHSKKDIGFVGEIQHVDPTLVNVLIHQGFIPVISSITLGPDGKNLNLNADDAAAKVAVALNATKLIYMTDVMGVLDGKKKLIQKLSISGSRELMRKKVIVGGMLPKVNNAMHAVVNGVASAHIINGQIPHALLLEMFTDEGIGTMIAQGGASKRD